MGLKLFGYSISLATVHDPLLIIYLVIILLLSLVLRQYVRMLVGMILALLFLQPSLLYPVAKHQEPTIAVITDNTASVDVGEQEKWQKTLKTALNNTAKIQPFTIQQSTTGSLISPVIEKVLGTVPKDLLSGIIIISDGQFHDNNLSDIKTSVPIHMLQTNNNQPDVGINIDTSSAYQLLGKPFSLSFIVSDNTKNDNADIPVTIYENDSMRTLTAKNNTKTTISIPTKISGKKTLIITTPPINGEKNLKNNASVFNLTVFRDKLRVMMVSGSPSPSARSFRSLFKQDPNIDLVHFSILRRMDSIDFTPPNELALIPFPVDELFLNKINSFDLIVIDSYASLGLLQPQHIDSLKTFIKRGGAMLLISGGEGVRPDSFINNFSDVLNINGNFNYQNQLFTPQISLYQHPITDTLRDKKLPQISGQLILPFVPQSARVIMDGNNNPLVAIWNDTPNNGRISLITTDNLWLWRRLEGNAFDTFMRRLIHWLLREPELENTSIKCTINVALLNCKNNENHDPIAIKMPNDEWTKINADNNGNYNYNLTQAGLYVLKQGTLLLPQPFNMGTPSEWKKPFLNSDIITKNNHGRILTDANQPIKITNNAFLTSARTLNIRESTSILSTQYQSWQWLIPSISTGLFVLLLIMWRWD